MEESAQDVSGDSPPLATRSVVWVAALPLFVILGAQVPIHFMNFCWANDACIAAQNQVPLIHTTIGYTVLPVTGFFVSLLGLLWALTRTSRRTANTIAWATFAVGAALLTTQVVWLLATGAGTSTTSNTCEITGIGCRAAAVVPSVTTGHA